MVDARIVVVSDDPRVDVSSPLCVVEPDTEVAGFANIVVGATDPEAAARAVRKAIEVVRTPGGTVHLVMGTRRQHRIAVPHERRDRSLQLDPTRSLLAEFERMAACRSVRVQVHPLFSDPAEGIAKVAVAEGADLVIVGSGAPPRGRVAGVPAEVVDRVMAELDDCAVLVV